MNNQSTKEMIKTISKTKLTNPIKHVFGGFVRFIKDVSLVTTVVLFAFFIHAYLVHMFFSPILLASAIGIGLCWIVLYSLEESWFSTKKGTVFERLTLLEHAVYGVQ